MHALNGTTIEIGRDCIVEEGAQLVCRPGASGAPTRMVVGDSNLFEVGCSECRVSFLVSRRNKRIVC